jgi:hypothetical protein
MTYKELYDKALWDLEYGKITLGEFEDMIEPLNKEIPKEEQTDRDLISRQAVLGIYDEWRYGKGITYTNGLQRLREQFEKLPSS